VDKYDLLQQLSEAQLILMDAVTKISAIEREIMKEEHD
jgi:hypothetical protein